jgi:hypothetical protein
MHVYHFEVFTIVFNILLLWLDFVNYMTLNKLSCFLQIGLLYLSTLIAISHAQRVFVREPVNGVLIFCYVLQFFITNPMQATGNLRALRAHCAKQSEVKTTNMNKTIKGRLQLKMRQKVQQKGN